MKIEFKTIVFIFLFVWAAQISAESLRCEFVFEDSLPFKGNYMPGMCPNNIFFLVKDLEKTVSKQELEKMQVLFIYPRWTGSTKYDLRFTKFEPLQTKNGAKKTWNFHVVLKHRGRIYDYEYKSKNLAVSSYEYFREMFGVNFSNKGYTENIKKYFFEGDDDPPPDEGAKLLMHVRVIPGDVYLSEYSFVNGGSNLQNGKTYSHWVNGDSRFPDQTLEEYLEVENGGAY
jgi:hypothetical protein